MAFMEGNADMSVGVSGVFAKASCAPIDQDGNVGEKEWTDNTPSTPIYAYAGFRIYDNLKAGIAVTTPFGNGINWGKDWSGAALVQDISLKVFSIQPTIAWRPFDNLSVGAGMMVAFGSVDLSKALIAPGVLPESIVSSDVTPVSVNIKGKSETRFGVNVGIMWDINEHWTLGASYRSKMIMKVKNGDASLDYAKVEGESIESEILGIASSLGIGSLPLLDEGTFSAELPCPANLTVGTSFKPNQRWTFALDLQMVGWSAYDKLEIKFHQKDLQNFNQNLTKNYRNTLAVRLGTQWAVTDRFDARAGFYYDGSPVDKNYFNPETPGMTKLCPTLGFSFRPYPGLSVDASCMYVAGVSRTGSYPTKIDENTGEVLSKFEGRYTTTAWSPSIGISYKF
jgi:long-chain fatty acid transport protein